ncbi:hypothetical protein DPMN_077752 [Dreissena polymorpha]|uniref:Uncharacterized protein n=1 Tax=Dreissena polymorpha TaxID=45954 RepID=A0A9D3YMJ5_DREPO|nr:hypothetical protein DPMN_077752 [Dreissena polymorpha]
MKSKVYGQHLVTDTLVRHLKGHINGNPRKALALSFHGWTGTGKNYVSQIVAETLYVKSMGSKYVLWIIPAVDFPHSDADPTTIASYKVCSYFIIVLSTFLLYSLSAEKCRQS